MEHVPDEPYVAIFTISVNPDRRRDFLAAMDRAMARSAREPGVLAFTLLVDRDDACRFTALDVYRDRASYEAHLAAPHSAALVGELEGCLAGAPAGSFHHLLRESTDYA